MKTIILFALILVSSVIVCFETSYAFNSEDLQRLMKTGSCVDCDLSGAVLIHMKLGGADLAGANLSGANLTDSYLAGANLEGANLSNAVLISTSLAGANLFRAKLGRSNLMYMDLSGATWVDGSSCLKPSSGWCKK